MRKTAMGTEFRVPEDDQWDERSRGSASGLAFKAGWVLLVIWAVGIAGFALGEAWEGTATLTEKLLVFGGISGAALLVLSVVLDRLKARKTDRYRGVQK